MSEELVKVRVIHCENLAKTPKFNYDTQYLFPKIIKTKNITHMYI